MSALTEQEINQFLEGLTDENFFQRAMALDAEDPDFVEACEATQEALRSSSEVASAKLLVIAVKGSLFWKIGRTQGRAASTKTGAGHFTGGNFIIGFPQPGSWKLTITRFKAEMRVYTTGGDPMIIWEGIGHAKGITGTYEGKFPN